MGALAEGERERREVAEGERGPGAERRRGKAGFFSYVLGCSFICSVKQRAHSLDVTLKAFCSSPHHKTLFMESSMLVGEGGWGGGLALFLFVFLLDCERARVSTRLGSLFFDFPPASRD